MGAIKYVGSGDKIQARYDHYNYYHYFLEKVYERTSGNQNHHLNMIEIGEEASLDHDDTIRLVKWLVGFRALKYGSWVTEYK